MHFNRADITKWALTAVLLAVVLALSVNADFYDGAMANVFMALALGSVLVTLLVVQFSWIDLAAVSLGSLLLAVLDYRFLAFHPKFMAAFSFVGLSSLLVLGLRTIWSSGPSRKLFLYAFIPAVLFVASEYTASTLLDYTEILHPKTFDLYLYSFDSSLHVQFSFLVGQLFNRFLWFRFVALLFYIALPLPLALIYAAHLRRKNNNAFQVMLAFLVTGPIGVLFYNLVPATGPIHVFGPNFPWHPLPASQVMNMALQTIPVKGARNAIPSLHMAWVLLIWWNSKGLSRWIRAIALAFLVFTALATLGMGEHYFVDLVVAFPFAVMVQALCLYSVPLKFGPRRAALLFGAFTSLAWMALVSFAIPIFWISPAIPWALVLTTLYFSLQQIHRLERVELSVDRTQSGIALGGTPVPIGN